MAKRACIVHGWGGSPTEGGFPWLKRELEARGFRVVVLDMPDTDHPTISAWVARISKEVGIPDEETFLIGHSIGAQAVIRYLEKIASRIGGAVLVAGWVTLTPAAYAGEGDEEIARPWLETPIDWAKARSHAGRFTAIFSDNDPFVPLSDAEVFRKNLGAKIIIEPGKGHFSGDDGITELPSVRDAVLEHAAVV